MSAALVAAIAELREQIKRLEKAARQPERKAYRPREVAELTGIGYEVVLELIHAGELDAVTVGRLHVVPAESVATFLARAKSGDVVQLDDRRSA
jgi:excisionase family DNA binding protein